MKEKSSAKPRTKPRNFTYNINHQLIERTLWNYLAKHKRLPTQLEMEKITGLDRSTIKTHIEEITLENYMPQLQKMTPKIMLGLAGKAVRGNPAAAKLWLQVANGFREKVDGEVSGTIMHEISVSHAEKIRAAAKL